MKASPLRLERIAKRRLEHHGASATVDNGQAMFTQTLVANTPQSSQNAPQHQVTLVRTQLPISPIRDRIGGIMAVCGMKRDRITNETFFPEPAPNTALDELMGEMKSLIDHRKKLWFAV